MSKNYGDWLACQHIITTMARLFGLRSPVLRQGDSDVFRANKMIQDKAQSAENGTVLFKGCNAVLDNLGGSGPVNITLTEYQ